MPEHLIKFAIIKTVVCLVATTICLSSYAMNTDTFNIQRYSIHNHQLKQCLSKIAKEESNNLHCQIGLVVVNIHQCNEEYLLVGCHKLAWLKFYSTFYEVRDNDFVGCSYLKNVTCFFFGQKIKEYLSDPIGMVCLVDSKGYFKPLLGSEADFNEWVNDYYQSGLHVDPPVWIFKKKGKKFVPMSNSDFQYNRPKHN